MKTILLTLTAISLGSMVFTQELPAVPALAALAPAERSASAENYTAQDNAADEGLTRTITKTFPAGSSDRIAVTNQFGSITIKTWEKKEVKADITISAYSSNAEEQRRLLEGTNIDAGKSGDQISFKTNMNTDRKGNWGNGTKNGKKWRREVRVNYVIYMPASNPLTLSQQYGNIEMGSFSGSVNAKVQYGNFNAERLNSSNNNLNVQYGKMTVQDLNKANLKQQYGGGITLGTARDITVSAQYSNVTIDRLIGDAVLNVQYNKLRIGQVAESSKVLTVSAQYGGVDVGFSDSYKGKMDVKTSYGSFKFGAGVSAKVEGDNEERVSFSKSYTGDIGGGGSGQVSIKSAYGSVTFR